jgi:gamma-glutamylcyclotransferase (GGCT)/AIG2-like uncharacterized protein YtfP
MTLSLDELAKIGAFLQGLAGMLLLAGGAFAWYRYRQGKRIDSIRWLTETGSKFYQFDKLDDRLRQEFEYDFDSLFAPVMEKWLVYPKALTQHDKDVLTRIDALLNFFELVCYVSHKDRYLRRSDREATFQYWFDDVFCNDEHVLLRLYLQFGFEHLRKRIRLGAPQNCIAVYGTLMQSVTPRISNLQLRQDSLAARQHLGAYLGPCRIRGKLVDLGEYPGLLPDDSGSVTGELYELPFGTFEEPAFENFRTAIREIDRFEGIEIDHPDRSEYTRRFVKLDSPHDTAAWVYFLNRPRSRPVPLPSGNWTAGGTGPA